jgi:hypothetical protein
MLKRATGKVMWVGRATLFLVGLSVIVGLVFGLASVAIGADGESFVIGQLNTAQSTSTLDKSGAGPALDLRVDSGPPLAVNSGAKVGGLNADKLDGKNATQIADNGLLRTIQFSARNSVSPKTVQSSCPAGKAVTGAGYEILGGRHGDPPNEQTDVVVDRVQLGFDSVLVEASEVQPAHSDWAVTVTAVCAKP